MSSKFSHAIENDPILGEVLVISYVDPEPDRSLTVKISPTYGSNIFSFLVGDKELIWCDKQALVDKKDLGAFTGNFVVSPIGVNREVDQKGIFDNQKLDFHSIPKPEGDAPLVHGFARLLEWNVGNHSVDGERVTVETYTQYGKDEDGNYYPYCEEAYPYQVKQTHKHVLTKDGLTVYAIFENTDDRTAPVAHTLHADFSTTISGPDKTLVTVPANKHIETIDLLPVYPPQLIDAKGTDKDLNFPTPVSELWLDDYYTDLDPSIPAVYEPKTEDFKVEITASPEYQHFVIFTQRKEEFVALERQTNMSTALKANELGYKDLANLIEVKPGETKSIWTKYNIIFD